MTHNTSPAAPDAAAMHARSTPAGVVSVFALVGPFAGAIALLGYLLASSRHPINDAVQQFQVVLAGSYLIGIVPAVVTGALMVHLIEPCRGRIGAGLVGALVGFVVSVVLGSLLWLVLENNRAAVLSGAMIMGCAGGVAGGVCGWLAKAVCCGDGK